jgi:hypothetical protein
VTEQWERELLKTPRPPDAIGYGRLEDGAVVWLLEHVRGARYRIYCLACGLEHAREPVDLIIRDDGGDPSIGGEDIIDGG